MPPRDKRKKRVTKKVKGGQGLGIGLHMSHYYPYNQTGGMEPPLPGGNDIVQSGGKKKSKKSRKRAKTRKRHKIMKGGFGPIGNLGTGPALMFGNSYSASTNASILAGQPYVSSDVIHQNV